VKKIVVLVMLLCFLCVPSAWADILWPEQYNVPKDYVFVIDYPVPIDISTVKSDTVGVYYKGELLKTYLSVTNDGKSISINPPNRGYNYGKKYKFFINGVKSVNGQISEAVSMFFHIEDSQDNVPQYDSVSKKSTGNTSVSKNAINQITQYRSMKHVHDPRYILSFGSRIINVQLELKIHKLRCEPDNTFHDMIRAEMFNLANGVLTFDGQKFQILCMEIINGQVSDDDAYTQLETMYCQWKNR